jgi:hypothetical protein
MSKKIDKIKKKKEKEKRREKRKSTGIPTSHQYRDVSSVGHLISRENEVLFRKEVLHFCCHIFFILASFRP